MSTQPEDKQRDDAFENPDDQYWQIPDNTSAELHCLRIAFETMTQCAHDHDAERRKYLRLSEKLLEALQYMVSACPAIDPSGEDAHAHAQAIIAKATGGQE
jgi:hypothetical protein